MAKKHNKTDERKLDTRTFDICVVGAGMVGAASAVMLAQLGLNVALVEPNMPEPFDVAQAPDLRISALNKHSINLLEQCKALDTIKKMRYRNYERLSVWENITSMTTFCAQDVKQTTLGLFAENRIIQLALLDALREHHSDTVTVFNAKPDKIDVISGELTLSDQTQLRVNLIIGADGASSQVRQSAGIGQTAWQYQQRANIISVNMHKAFADETWQQFTPTGPLAFLPMHENYASLVWYADANTSKSIQAMNKDELKVAIKNTFPDKLGDFDVLSQAGFGLTRMHAKHYYKHRAVLVGDAAHTINPLAGQGVNLGFKDVAALYHLIKEHVVKKHVIKKHVAEDLPQLSMNPSDLENALRRYQTLRKPQNLIMMSTMDVLYAGFSNDIAPIKALRNIALGAAQKAGPLKNLALKYAMGL